MTGLKTLCAVLLGLCSQAAFGQGDELRRWAAENEFSGVVLVADESGVIFHEGIGFADRELEIAHGRDTQYPIASITKWFTSVLVLQLHEEGAVDLERPVSDYLPQLENEVFREITLHHLLTHTSGLENVEAKGNKVNGVSEIYVEELELDDAIATYCSGPLVSEVGSSWDYNNGDYIVLGKVIESVTGKPYSSLLKERILDPLDMNDTGMILGSKETEGLARGYYWDDTDDSLKPNPPTKVQNYFAAGAMYSNARDLLMFVDAFFEGKLVSERSRSLLLRTYPETPGYGYGVWVRYPEYNRTVPKVVQRYGRLWGINTLVSHFIEDDITVVVLSNVDMHPGVIQDLVGESLLK
jgi:D-alanyl-D-alanine carboxypeptidase